MDALEDQRLVPTEKILNLKEPEGDHFLQLDPIQIKQFIRRYKEKLEEATRNAKNPSLPPDRVSKVGW